MKFENQHKEYFKAITGAYSEVTERENHDSQLTLDKDEKSLFVNFFGSSNILHGNTAVNPEAAAKEFLVYPEMNRVKLNLVFPKHNKPELRLYLSKDHGFKPDGGEIWFSYINQNKQLVIGSMPSNEWTMIALNQKTKTIPNQDLETAEFDSEKIRVGKHTFEPGAMTIIQMGQELIGHPTTAVNELVKNGYDADATSVKVYFYFDRKVENDNGSGMNTNTLFGDWLQPSVSSKRSGTKLSDDFKRNLLGSKGVGRLAAMALGESVTVVTKRIEEIEYNWINVIREDFRKSLLLSEVKFPGDRINKVDRIFANKSLLEERKSKKNDILIDFLAANEFSDFSNGTLIVVEKLDKAVLKILGQDFTVHSQEIQYEEFSYKNTEFYKALATLITPISLNETIEKELVFKGIINKEDRRSFKKGDFNVELGTNLLPDQEVNEIDWLPVAPIPIHSVCDYRVYGKVTTKGELKGLIIYNRIPNEFHEEKFELPSSELRNKEDQMNLFENNSNSGIGEYYFDIRIYDIGENDNIEKLANQAGFDNKSEFKAAFKNFQGLRVSKNGFGVKPYGEEVEDWIGLSRERVMDPGHNVNTNQILGYVFFFSPQNDVLEEKTNREGFLENTAFIQVRNDLRKLFKAIGVLRYNYRVRHNLGRIPKSKHSRPDFDHYLDFVNKNDSIAQIRKESEGFVKEVTTSMDNLEESLTFSERLASLGSGIELVYHEMAQPISGLRTVKSSLEIKKKRITNEVMESYTKDITSLTYATDVLVQLRDSLLPAIGKSRKRSFSPVSTFLKVCNLFKSDIDENSIEIIISEKDKDYKIEDLEYAFWISFLNIVNNAVYWIKKSGSKCSIELSIDKNENIIISNSGPYIKSDIIDHIFSYGVTTRTEKNATGLGLAFTQSILNKNDWVIFAENRKIGPTFIIRRKKNE